MSSTSAGSASSQDSAPISSARRRTTSETSGALKRRPGSRPGSAERARGRTPRAASSSRPGLPGMRDRTSSRFSTRHSGSPIPRSSARTASASSRRHATVRSNAAPMRAATSSKERASAPVRSSASPLRSTSPARSRAATAPTSSTSTMAIRAAPAPVRMVPASRAEASCMPRFCIRKYGRRNTKGSSRARTSASVSACQRPLRTKESGAVARPEILTTRGFPACAAARTRLPSSSHCSGWAGDTTSSASTPSSARARDARSARSPATGWTPSGTARARSVFGRTSARGRWPRATSSRAAQPPIWPVAPVRRISLEATVSGYPGRGHERVGRSARTAPRPRARQGRASSTRLKGVSAARRTRSKPPASRTARSRRSPAWAPRQAPTSCARDAGVQISVENE